jgi:hypothetical protein
VPGARRRPSIQLGNASSLPKDKWLEAIRSGKVSVAYCIDDPSINALEHDFRSNYNALLGFSIVAGAGLLASLLWFAYLIGRAIVGWQDSKA